MGFLRRRFECSRHAHSGFAREAGVGKLMSVWMRTAVHKQVTSFGTFLSTLCHEFCHHLVYERFRFQDSWHTRGFYERTAALTTHEERRKSACSRCHYRATGGGSTGRARIATPEDRYGDRVGLPWLLGLCSPGRPGRGSVSRLELQWFHLMRPLTRDQSRTVCANRGPIPDVM
jgi:hypothetical protein